MEEETRKYKWEMGKTQASRTQGQEGVNATVFPNFILHLSPPGHKVDTLREESCPHPPPFSEPTSVQKACYVFCQMPQMPEMFWIYFFTPDIL